MTLSRREQERENRYKLIVKTAESLMEKEGPEGISIRRIAAAIGYSPAVIYYYFKNKDEIIAEVLGSGYRKMIEKLEAGGQHPPDNAADPVSKLLAVLERFIRMAIADGARYRNIMLSDSPEVLKRTAILHQGAASEREALGILVNHLRELPCWSEMEEGDREAKAQILWCSAFGLITRLTVEHSLPEAHKNRLIAEHLKMTRCWINRID